MAVWVSWLPAALLFEFFCLTFLNGQLSILTTHNGLLLAFSLACIIFFSNMMCSWESDNQACFNCLKSDSMRLIELFND